MLKKQWFKVEIKEGIIKYETNDNENTTTENLLNAAKAVLSKMSLPEKTREISNKYHIIELEKKGTHNI